ncbi:MAG: DUF501 domain-containing protein [Myxococcales bacterium]|nr:DUF501 domain-containing protein [Myxococcales bacterium]
MVDDREALRVQLGRPLRAESDVVRRCSLRLPIVVAVPPVLASGEPFPTRYWLTCPLARKRIARLENAGGVRHFDARVAAEPAFAEALRAAHDDYASERDALIEGEVVRRPSGGIAGIDQAGVKCLHALFAHHAAGGDNPVGAAIAPFVEPLECAQPCVGEGTWAEPPHAVTGPGRDPSRAFEGSVG